MQNKNLTPTEDLVMEVLAARYRLGHTAWTLSRSRTVTHALIGLSHKGLVWWKYGTTENSALAGLTEQGQASMLMSGYVPPILGGPK